MRNCIVCGHTLADREPVCPVCCFPVWDTKNGDIFCEISVFGLQPNRHCLRNGSIRTPVAFSRIRLYYRFRKDLYFIADRTGIRRYLMRPAFFSRNDPCHLLHPSRSCLLYMRCGHISHRQNSHARVHPAT